MQSAQPTDPAQPRGIGLAKLLWAGPLAAGAASAANALVYLVSEALGAIPRGVLIPAAGEPLTLGPVVFASAAGAIGATVAYALVGLLERRRPARVFRIISAAVLVLSFATPFTIPGAPASMVASLLLMHVVAWAVIVALLTRLARAG